MISRDALITGYACPRRGCGAAAGAPCLRRNGEPRISQHAERWAAAGYSLADLRRAAHERRL